MLKVESIVKSIKRKVILNNISLIVNSGKIVGLFGPNGAGKTTTFLIISGFLKQDSGRIILNGKDISAIPAYERSKYGIILLPQNATFFPEISVYDNFKMVCDIRGISEKNIYSICEEFSIAPLLQRISGTLSGGERRKAEIARAFMTSPSFLLLDEPFAGIEPKMVEKIISMILRIKNSGTGILISDHNVRDAMSSCDFSYIIYEGRVLTYGTPSDVLQSQFAREIFFGESFTL